MDEKVLAEMEKRLEILRKQGVGPIVSKDPDFYEKYLREYGYPVVFEMEDDLYGCHCISFIIIGSEDDWEFERQALEDKCPLACVYNVDADIWEMGSVFYEVVEGCPKRTA